MRGGIVRVGTWEWLVKFGSREHGRSGIRGRCSDCRRTGCSSKRNLVERGSWPTPPRQGAAATVQPG
jgi:hypothetical protein